MSADALREAALQVDIPLGGTIQGYGVKFNPPEDVMAGQNSRSICVVMQFENAKSHVIWPSEIGREPVLPLPPENPYALKS